MVVGVVLASGGCMGRLIGEGAEGAMGPKGEYFEEKPVAAAKEGKGLEAYQRFELGEVKNDFGRNVPPAFLREFPGKFAEQLAKSELPKAVAGKTAVFHVSILHYETADLTDHVLGPLEQVIAKVQLVDKDTGDVIAFGNALGRTGKTVGMGTGTKAEGLAKALIKWASDYYTKPKTQ
jgi:hypothetical protein